MKQLIKKFAEHGQKNIHPTLAFPVIILTLFCLFVLPLLSLAQEITDLTPIVHQYKITQTSEQNALISPNNEIVAPSIEPSIAPDPPAATEPKTEVMANGSNNTQPTLLTPTSELNKVENPQKETLEQNFEDQTEVEFIDPREVQNARREIKRMQTDMKRFVKQLKKMPNSGNDVASANDILTQLNEHWAAINNPPADASLREMLQDFWDARMWEEVDGIRAKVEIPRELTSITKDLKKLKKSIKLKAYKTIGFDMEAMIENIAEMENAYNDAKSNYEQGNLDDAWSAMETFHNGLYPGEALGALNQINEIKNQIRFVKNQEVKNTTDALLVDIVASVDAGDFRDANQALNDTRNELMKIMSKFAKQTSVLDDKTRSNLDKLESMMQEKLNKNDAADAEKKPVAQ